MAQSPSAESLLALIQAEEQSQWQGWRKLADLSVLDWLAEWIWRLRFWQLAARLAARPGNKVGSRPGGVGLDKAVALGKRLRRRRPWPRPDAKQSKRLMRRSE